MSYCNRDVNNSSHTRNLKLYWQYTSMSSKSKSVWNTFQQFCISSITNNSHWEKWEQKLRKVYHKNIQNFFILLWSVKWTISWWVKQEFSEKQITEYYSIFNSLIRISELRFWLLSLIKNLYRSSTRVISSKGAYIMCPTISILRPNMVKKF